MFLEKYFLDRYEKMNAWSATFEFDIKKEK